MSFKGYATCEYCIYYDILSMDYGYCRRLPPYIHAGSERYYGGVAAMRGEWPVVCTIEWCGEFRRHPQSMESPPPIPKPPEGGMVVTPIEHVSVSQEVAEEGDKPAESAVTFEPLSEPRE